MTAYHGDMVEVVDEEDGAQLLGLEGARQLHQQIHARIPHAVQVVVQLPVLHHKERFMHIDYHKTHVLYSNRCDPCTLITIGHMYCTVKHKSASMWQVALSRCGCAT